MGYPVVAEWVLPTGRTFAVVEGGGGDGPEDVALVGTAARAGTPSAGSTGPGACRAADDQAADPGSGASGTPRRPGRRGRAQTSGTAGPRRRSRCRQTDEGAA